MQRNTHAPQKPRLEFDCVKEMLHLALWQPLIPPNTEISNWCAIFGGWKDFFFFFFTFQSDIGATRVGQGSPEKCGCICYQIAECGYQPHNHKIVLNKGSQCFFVIFCRLWVAEEKIAWHRLVVTYLRLYHLCPIILFAEAHFWASDSPGFIKFSGWQLLSQ